MLPTDLTPEGDTAIAALDTQMLGEMVSLGAPIWQRTELVGVGPDGITGMCAPIRADGALLGAMTLISVSRPPPTDEIRWAIETVAVHLAGVLERRLLDRAIAETTASEQKRIGSDLHDSVSQELSGAALLGDAIADRLTARADPDSDSVRAMNSGVRRAMRSIRLIVEGLVSLHVEGAGFVSAVERVAENAATRTEVLITTAGAPGDLPDHIARELLMIASEALLNTIQHGSPTSVRIAWGFTETNGADAVCLEISDNGTGLAEQNGYSIGRGLSIMRRRASVIDATFWIGNNEKGGATVREHVKKKLDQPSATALTQFAVAWIENLG